MLSFFFALIFSAAAHAREPLCPFNAAAAKAQMAPGARADMEGLENFFADFKIRFGRCLKIEKKKDSVLRYEGADIPFRITRNKQNKWMMVSFGPPDFPGDSPDKLEAEAAKAGVALTLVEEGSAPAIAVKEKEAREVGEAAQILWLAEYRHRLAATSLRRTQSVATRPYPDIQSLGPLLSWPPGIPLTLESLALLAFRSRDNVAADLLLEGLSFKVGEKAVAPYSQLAMAASPASSGWRHSAQELCEAALFLKEDPAFPNGVGAAVEKNRFYEFTGEFPRALNITQLWQKNPGGPWACASVTYFNPTPESFTRARDFLERGAELLEKRPSEAPGSAGKDGEK